MKNLLISRPIISLIAPYFKKNLILLLSKICITMEQEVVMDSIVSHFEIFDCALLDQLVVIVKAHLLQLYIL